MCKNIEAQHFEKLKQPFPPQFSNFRYREINKCKLKKKLKRPKQ